MTKAPDINELIYKRQQIRAQKSVFYTKYQELGNMEKEVDHQIMLQLSNMGTKKWETLDNKFQATIKDNPPTFEIRDEAKVIDWLKQQGADIKQFVGLHKSAFTPFARQVLKKTGELPPETQMVVTQSLLVTDRTQTKQVEA